MPLKKLTEFLEEKKIKYSSITHPTQYTAQEVAAAAHVPGKELAKTVMVKLDGKFAMAVLPASYKVDFELLKDASGATKAELAHEEEFQTLFPECEVGAMPPFGNLYGMDVYVAKALTEDGEIAFNAGTHTELIKLAYEDFEKTVKPKIVDFSKQEG
jgi:Ala-tRNA(Pro) deacylase